MGVASSLFLLSVASTVPSSNILLGSKVPTIDLSLQRVHLNKGGRYILKETHRKVHDHYVEVTDWLVPHTRAQSFLALMFPGSASSCPLQPA